MSTPCYDLACEAMEELLRALRDPNQNPARVIAFHEATKLALKAVLENFDTETATLEDCAKLALDTDLEAGARIARLWAERRMGELLPEEE